MWTPLDSGQLRRLVALASAWAYHVYDPAPQQSAAWFGCFRTSAQSLNPAEVSSRLQRPGFVVKRTQTPLPGKSAMAFRHECVQAEAFQAFASAAGRLLHGRPDPFELSARIRKLAGHADVEPELTAPATMSALRMAQAGKSLTCRPFTILHAAACLSQGYTSRMLGLSFHGHSFDHAVTEVYLPQLAKWVLIDCDFNIAYQRDGVWLSAGDLHRGLQELKQKVSMPGQSGGSLPKSLTAQETRELTGIELVPLGSAGEKIRKSHIDGNSTTGIDLELYEHVFYPVRNDLLSGQYPPGHPCRWRQFVLQPNRVAPPIEPAARVVRDATDLEWSQQTTTAEFLSSSKDSMELQLSTWTPEFSHFEVCIDGVHWQRQSGSRVHWSLQPGENHMQARAVNTAGLPGKPVDLRLFPSKASSDCLPSVRPGLQTVVPGFQGLQPLFGVDSREFAQHECSHR